MKGAYNKYNLRNRRYNLRSICNIDTIDSIMIAKRNKNKSKRNKNKSKKNIKLEKANNTMKENMLSSS